MDFNATLIGQTIAMIVFVWFCMKKIWPPLREALDKRREEIAAGLAAGEQAVEAQAQAEVEARKLVDEARSQAIDIVDQANKRANAIVAEGKEDGVKERERQIAAGRAEIEQELNKAKDELRGQVSAIAVTSAEKILKREIDANAHNDLLSQLASQI
ncbi:MAG: F0F1 ATP synthase subunit B [Gammaproteobacteria bacterium]